MSAKRKIDADSAVPSKKTRKPITLEVKREILILHEWGMKVNELAAKFKMSHSTISTILKDKQKYMYQIESATPMQSTVVRKREGLVSEVEKFLIKWIDNQTQSDVTDFPLNQATISAMALSVFETLKNQRGSNLKHETFTASKGWYDRFRRRAGWQTLKGRDEIVGTNASFPKDFPDKLAEIVEEGGYCSRLVFNVDETVLSWKRLPSRSYHIKTEEEHSNRVENDRLTLLLGSNASGDCKLKPLLIYRMENPKALKGLVKTTLPVIWKSNPKICMTATIFEDWFAHHFVPEVKKYCSDNGLPFKAVLVMDNGPGHVAILQHHHPNIKIIFLPPKSARFLQPMSQGIVSTFKAYYLRRTFEKLLEAVDKEDGPTVDDVWKHFNILYAVKIIKDVWNEISIENLKSAWKNLCPQFVQKYESFLNPIESVTETVVQIANRLNLEISSEDVIELLNNDESESSDDNLVHKVERDTEEDDEEVEETTPAPGFTIERLSEAFQHIESALKIFETDDPNFERSSKVIAAIKNDFDCYKEIYHEKKNLL